MKQMGTYGLLILVMMIWGLNVVAVKYLVEYFPPVMMQSLRIGIAGLCAITILYFLKDLRKLSKKEWALTALAACFGQIGHHSMLAIGLVETTASNASLILGLIPLTTAIFAMIFLGDRLTTLRLTGILSGFTGVTFVVMNPAEGVSGISQGDMYVFVAMVSQVISFIIIKMATKTLSSRQLTGLMLLIGSTGLFLLSFFFEPGSLEKMSSSNQTLWVVFFSSAVIATGLGHIMYNAAIQKIGAGQTAVFNNFVPLFALIGSFFLLGEPIHLSQLTGFVFIVCGVLLGTGYVEQLRIVKKAENTRSNPVKNT